MMQAHRRLRTPTYLRGLIARLRGLRSARENVPDIRKIMTDPDELTELNPPDDMRFPDVPADYDGYEHTVDNEADNEEF